MINLIQFCNRVKQGWDARMVIFFFISDRIFLKQLTIIDISLHKTQQSIEQIG